MSGRLEGITTAEIRRTVPGWTVFSHPCPGGETHEQVAHRCQRLLRACEGRFGAERRLALFAHGHILRALAGTWLGLGPAGGALLSLSTGTISVLGRERVQAVLLRWNAPVLSGEA